MLTGFAMRLSIVELSADCLSSFVLDAKSKCIFHVHSVGMLGERHGV